MRELPGCPMNRCSGLDDIIRVCYVQAASARASWRSCSRTWATRCPTTAWSRSCPTTTSTRRVRAQRPWLPAVLYHYHRLPVTCDSMAADCGYRQDACC